MAGAIERELDVLVFTGDVTREEDHTIITSEEAPVVGSGQTDRDAQNNMDAALFVYVKTLSERGELKPVLDEGKIPVIRVFATLSEFGVRVPPRFKPGNYRCLIPLDPYLAWVR